MFFGWVVGIASAAAMIGTVLVLLPLTGKWVQRAAGGIAGATGAFALAVWLGSTVNAIGVTDPYTVELGAWLLVAMVAPLYGLIALLLLPKGERPPVDVASVRRVSVMSLSLTETAAWSRTISSWIFVSVTIVMVVIGGVLWVPLVVQDGFAESGFGIVVYLIALLVVFIFCAFRVNIDRRGLRVTSFVLGIPLKRIALENIQTVETALLEPMEWGGWGYRVMPGRSALILRKGPGIVLTLRDEKQFAITLEEPEEPASILLGLMAQPQSNADGQPGR